MVAQWFTLKVVSRSWGYSVWSLLVLPVSALVHCGFSHFLTQFKNVHVRPIRNFELSVGVCVSVNVAGMNGRLDPKLVNKWVLGSALDFLVTRRLLVEGAQFPVPSSKLCPKQDR